MNRFSLARLVGVRLLVISLLLVPLQRVAAGGIEQEQEGSEISKSGSEESRGSETRTDQEDDTENKQERPRPRRVGPMVRSSAKAAEKRGSRDYVQGGSSYESSVDWASLPSWQWTSFFDVRSKGTFFIFVIDSSGSMADDFRLFRAKQELRRCINKMRSPQRYLVIFYNDQIRMTNGGIPSSSETLEKRRTSAWLNSINAIGGTDPRGAMSRAIGLKPDAVFLLSDGEFPEGTASQIGVQNLNTHVPIHCIDLAGGLGAVQLKAIAEESGGRYALRRN